MHLHAEDFKKYPPLEYRNHFPVLIYSAYREYEKRFASQVIVVIYTTIRFIWDLKRECKIVSMRDSVRLEKRIA